MSNNQNYSCHKVFLRRLDPLLDHEMTFIWRNDPVIYKWCRQNDGLHLSNHNKWLEAQAYDSTMSMYAIATPDTAIIGVCGLTSIDYVNRRAEFSLYIEPGHQGKGLGEAALRALLDKGFNTYGLNSIWGESLDGNPAIEMFKKVGFKYEGTRREFYYRNGKFVNAHLFSIVRSEYDSSIHIDRNQSNINHRDTQETTSERKSWFDWYKPTGNIVWA